MTCLDAAATVVAQARARLECPRSAAIPRLWSGWDFDDHSTRRPAAIFSFGDEDRGCQAGAVASRTACARSGIVTRSTRVLPPALSPAASAEPPGGEAAARGEDACEEAPVTTMKMSGESAPKGCAS